MIAAWQSRVSPQVSGGVGGLATLLVFVGVYLLPPYLIFLLVVWTRFRHAAGSVLRRIALAAPLLIAIPFAPVFAFVEAPREFGSFITAMALGATWALCVGYIYVGAIEGVRAVGVRTRWVVRDY
jgi:hypothetical protein